jgi:hypothetical protein
LRHGLTLSLVSKMSGNGQVISWQISRMKNLKKRDISLTNKLQLILLVACIALISIPASQGQQRSSSALPVIFGHKIDASKAQIGDPVVARTLQDAMLPSGAKVPKGSVVLGRVTGVRRFSFDATPYAIQHPSYLAIRFIEIKNKEGSIPVQASVRALADYFDSENAFQTHYHDETDGAGTRIQIGGTEYGIFDTTVLSPEGNAIEYNRRNGVYARLLPAQYVSRYSTFACGGTNTEQSLAIFSPYACGLYGFDGAYMTDDTENSFRLESRLHSVSVAARSTALLEIGLTPSSR